MTTNVWLRIVKKLFVASLYFFWVVGSIGCGGEGVFDSYADKPNAHAGTDQNVLVDTLVTLDGSGSANNGANVLSFFWTFVSLPQGSNAILNDAKRVKSTFTADIEGEYVVKLTVVSVGGDDADTVVITAVRSNSTPVSNAGPDQNVTTGSLVTLDGSFSSDANNDRLSYSWAFVSKPASSSAILSDSNASQPTFIADLNGVYVLGLVVDDGFLSSVEESVTVTADSINSAPVAIAGPDQNVAMGSAVTLNGSASSDADGDPLNYSWALISQPPGSSANLSNDSNASPTFTADLNGDYLLSLVVDDGIASSASDRVVVTALID